MQRLKSIFGERFQGKKEHQFKMLYGALFLLSLHWALVIYINSSYLGQFMSATSISALYIAGSITALVLFIYMPYFLRGVGCYTLTLLFTLLEIGTVIGMAVSDSVITASFFFLLHFILVPLILFNLDVFIEALIGQHESETGTRRGLYLSLLSLATAIGPLLTGSLILTDTTPFALTYIVSSLPLIPFLAIMFFYFRTFIDPEYTLLSLRSMKNIFVESRDTRNIVIISVHLQLFFTWMVIYTPLYLAHVVGFSWKEIGLIMFVGLSAYVFFEYPIGVIADRYTGEKEMMAFGFVLLAVSTSWFSFLTTASIGLWMIAMFLTRVGASFVESTSESYFFKHAGSIDAHKISLFRMTRPLASILGAVLGSTALLYMDFNLVFIFLAILMIPGLFFTLLLKDTR